jgi:prepilin-type N-terminal cleavage/methylation domain-containing protein
MAPRSARGDAGFSLPEMMISMGIMLVVLAGTFAAMTNAMQAHQTVRGITTLNGHLRASMDLVVRDLLQVGQGLQTGRNVGVPSGDGSQPIVRPGPAPSVVGAVACAGVTTFPVAPTISAVTVGPDLGPPINGQCTDVITSLAVDGTFDDVDVTAVAANGQSITITPAVNISDVPDVEGNNVRVGDLIEVRRGNVSVLQYVTAVAAQTITFAPGDPLDLNQFDPALDMLGTMDQLLQQTGDTVAYKVRMITYFVDITSNPASPRLVRQIGAGPTNAVAFELEAFRLTYDLADGVDNPSGVRMNATDLSTSGPCDPFPCSPNQIRKANVALAIRSEQRTKQAGYYHNTLFTQVAIRSLSFVDRYR